MPKGDRVKTTKLTAVLVLCSLMLVSCASLLDKLGFDTYDYMSEPILSTHPADGETADMLEDFLSILVTDSTNLPTFTKTGDAIREYRDAVLSYMLKTGYAKYSGNTALIAKAEKAYPEYSITQIIPESDFEATMYRTFGGDVKISHRDGKRFMYLSKVGAYISPVIPEDHGFEIAVTKLEETEKTYRVRFRVLADNGEDSEIYFALVIKREDGTLYIKRLVLSSDMS